VTSGRALRRPNQAMQQQEHQQLWRIVEGAVADGLNAHPEYLTDRGRAAAVGSITKRVVGQLVGYHTEARKRGPLGACSAATRQSCGDVGGLPTLSCDPPEAVTSGRVAAPPLHHTEGRS
jgi:hypothetical protein